jgi:hypothetical protein
LIGVATIPPNCKSNTEWMTEAFKDGLFLDTIIDEKDFNKDGSYYPDQVIDPFRLSENKHGRVFGFNPSWCFWADEKYARMVSMYQARYAADKVRDANAWDNPTQSIVDQVMMVIGRSYDKPNINERCFNAIVKQQTHQSITNAKRRGNHAYVKMICKITQRFMMHSPNEFPPEIDYAFDLNLELFSNNINDN